MKYDKKVAWNISSLINTEEYSQNTQTCQLFTTNIKTEIIYR